MVRGQGIEESRWDARSRRCEMGMRSKMNGSRSCKKSRKSRRSMKNMRNVMNGSRSCKKSRKSRRSMKNMRNVKTAEGRTMRERTWEGMRNNGSQRVRVEEEAG